MSDRLISRNGHTIEIDSVIEALERTPDKKEILEALQGLRKDKLKNALNETVKAARFDLRQTLSEFLNDGEKAEQTQKTYLSEVARFLSWLERQNIHVLQVQRPDVNRYKAYLYEKYSNNTIRLSLAACSSFYKYLEAEGYIERSPFTYIKYPKKVYKKALRPDQGKPVPVMNDEEYGAIVDALKRKANAPGHMIYDERLRESARRLLPIVHFMATYGLRVGDVLTVRVEDSERFSYRAKGGRVQQRDLRAMSRDYLDGKLDPFKGIAKVTVQGAIKRVTAELAAQGAIRHAYSAHDFRHYFAVRLYQETHDVYAVKDALGHAAISVTEVYLASLGAEA